MACRAHPGLVAEAMERGPGSDVVMASSPTRWLPGLALPPETTDEPGWLHGLRDPAISRSLSALHSDLRYPWTVAGLARAAGLSRAGFAARFSALVGQSPMTYVFGSRMRRAETLLRTDHLTVAAVASQVGYGSESALSAAFLRYSGTTRGRTASCPPNKKTRPARIAGLRARTLTGTGVRQADPLLGVKRFTRKRPTGRHSPGWINHRAGPEAHLPCLLRGRCLLAKGGGRVQGERHIRDLSTSNSAPGEDGSKPCSISQRAAFRLRHDHHARITSRSTSVP